MALKTASRLEQNTPQARIAAPPSENHYSTLLWRRRRMGLRLSIIRRNSAFPIRHPSTSGPAISSSRVSRSAQTNRMVSGGIATNAPPMAGRAVFPVFETGAILSYHRRQTVRFLNRRDLRGRSSGEWVIWQMSALGPMLGQHWHLCAHKRPGWAPTPPHAFLLFPSLVLPSLFSLPVSISPSSFHLAYTHSRYRARRRL